MDRSAQRLSQRPAVRRHHRPLSARNALQVSSIITGAGGLILLVSPHAAMSAIGVGQVGDAAYWMRAAGGVIVAMAIVMASAARWPASMMQRPVLLGAGIALLVTAFFGGLALADGKAGAGFAPIEGLAAATAVWIWWILITDRV